jgi:hypothetical protein
LQAPAAGKIERLDFIRQRDKEHQRQAIVTSHWLNGEIVPQLQPTFRQVADEFAARAMAKSQPHRKRVAQWRYSKTFRLLMRLENLCPTWSMRIRLEILRQSWSR